MRRCFRFRLEHVLEAKRRAERRQQYELAVLLDTQAATRRRRERVMERVAGLRQRFGRCLSEQETCAVHELIIMRAEIDAMQGEVEALEQETTWLEQSVVKERHKLHELARARLLLERLRERAHADYLLAARREEAAVLDDIRRPDVAAIWGS